MRKYIILVVIELTWIFKFRTRKMSQKRKAVYF